MMKAYTTPTTPANTPIKMSAKRRHTRSSGFAAFGLVAFGLGAFDLGAIGAASMADVARSELEIDEVERRAVTDFEHAEPCERRRAHGNGRPWQRPHVLDLVGRRHQHRNESRDDNEPG